MNYSAAQPVHIGEAAEALGVSARYIRRLEAEGLILRANRDARGFRVYYENDIALLQEQGVGSRPRRLKQAEVAAGG